MPQIVAIVNYQLSPFWALLTHREHYWQTEFILFLIFFLKSYQNKIFVSRNLVGGATATIIRILYTANLCN